MVTSRDLRLSIARSIDYRDDVASLLSAREETILEIEPQRRCCSKLMALKSISRLAAGEHLQLLTITDWSWVSRLCFWDSVPGPGEIFVSFVAHFLEMPVDRRSFEQEIGKIISRKEVRR